MVALGESFPKGRKNNAMSYGIITPAGHLSSLLGHLTQLSLTGQPQGIATVLDDLAPQLNELGRSDLGGRLTRVSVALQSGGYLRTDWHNSKLYGEIERIHEDLKNGASLDEALQLQRAGQALQELTGPSETGPQSITTRGHRTPIGQLPLIEWKKYGTEAHPAPNPPSESIDSAGKLLSYFAHYVAGVMGHGQREIDTEQFYRINSHTRRQLRSGRFIHSYLGRFPTAEARRLIDRATAIEPLWGRLMQHLVIFATFEAYGWSLSLPNEHTHWDDSFRYALRRHAVIQLLSERGKERVLDDKAMINVIRRKVSLESVNWHPGRTRREVFNEWLVDMSGHNPRRLGAQQRYIGNSLLRDLNWAEPDDSSSNPLKDQWFFRYWTCHYHYGALPARGLFVPTASLVRFATIKQPADLSSRFQAGLMTMFGDFFTPEELRSKKIRRAA